MRRLWENRLNLTWNNNNLQKLHLIEARTRLCFSPSISLSAILVITRACFQGALASLLIVLQWSLHTDMDIHSIKVWSRPRCNFWIYLLEGIQWCNYSKLQPWQKKYTKYIKQSSWFGECMIVIIILWINDHFNSKSSHISSKREAYFTQHNRPKREAEKQELSTLK